jgi:hypothetical protein
MIRAAALSQAGCRIRRSRICRRGKEDAECRTAMPQRRHNDAAFPDGRYDGIFP